MAACLSVVEASAYLSSSSVLQFLLLLPYNSSTYLRAVSSEMLSEDAVALTECYSAPQGLVHLGRSAPHAGLLLYSGHLPR